MIYNILLIWTGLSLVVAYILDDPNQELAKVSNKKQEKALIIVAPLYLFYLFMGLVIAPIVNIAIGTSEWAINFILGWFD